MKKMNISDATDTTNATDATDTMNATDATDTMNATGTSNVTNEANVTKHKIYVSQNGVEPGMRLPVKLIKSCIRTALRLENVDKPCEVSVLITDDAGIRELNHKFREIDKPTDVLSFPMFEFIPPGWKEEAAETDPETGLFPLGEIVLSAEQVSRQAAEFGQTTGREAAYLTVHSVLHLLGYDHIDEASGKRQMRERETDIIKALAL